MKIVHVSDSHGVYQFDNIPQCDVLCITGDWSPLHLQYQTDKCYHWLASDFLDKLEPIVKSNTYVVLIAGNHDFITEDEDFATKFNFYLKQRNLQDKIIYLNNESVTINNVNFYGCPYTDTRGWAWYSGRDIKNYMPKSDTDVMLVHQAPDFGGLGVTYAEGRVYNFGSAALLNAIQRITPHLVLCGHVHGGSHFPIKFEGLFNDCIMHNGSVLNEAYEYEYEPLVIDVEKRRSQKMSIKINDKVLKEK